MATVSPRDLERDTHAGEEAVFSAFAESVRRSVDTSLPGYLERSFAEVVRHGDSARAVADAVTALTLRGGKRIRAVFLAAGYGMCRGDAELDAIRPGLFAMELLQSYLLIHDDWMDGDEVRRGGPTAHIALRAAFSGEHEADSAAILAGDLAMALAQRALAECGVSADRLARAIQVFADVQRDVVTGQILDVGASTRVSVETIHALKTTSYTIRGPLALGLALAGADATLARSVDTYAAAVGALFQWRDDWLGVFGSSDDTGKPLFTDLRREKRTAATEALDACGADWRPLARAWAASQSASAPAELARMVRESGAEARLLGQIEEKRIEAESAADRMPIEPGWRSVLKGGAAFIAGRTT